MTTASYRLTPEATDRATAAGLVEAEWYQTPIPTDVKHRLVRRTDGRATVDALLWLALLVASGSLAAAAYPSWWALPAFAIYGTLYGGASDARWHEYGHGTAFKTRWANQALYYAASFMLLREPTVSRWTHVRHHSDTIVVGRDPEIIMRRPPGISVWALNLLNLVEGPKALGRILVHATGHLSKEEASYVPAPQRRAVTIEARAFLAVLVGVIAVCISAGSPLPALLVGLPTFYGASLLHVLNITQHAGLPENVLDHRQNSRTFLFNRVGRFLYLNMNYHIEHHMYPAVPYHQLPRLHDTIKHDLPEANRSLLAVYREIIPALLQQRHDPDYEIERPLPEPRHGAVDEISPPASPDEPEPTPAASSDALVAVADVDAVAINQPIRFDHDGHTYAIYRLGEDEWYATDGICTHSRTVHLSTGSVIDGEIECPKHNGRFDVATGEPTRAPACVALETFPVVARAGRVYLQTHRQSTRPQTGSSDRDPE